MWKGRDHPMYNSISNNYINNTTNYGVNQFSRYIGNNGRPWVEESSNVASMCPDCDKLFRSASAMEQHRVTSHPDSKTGPVGAGVHERLPAAWTQSVARCEGCGEKFKSETGLLQHQEASLGCRRKKRYNARCVPLNTHTQTHAQTHTHIPRRAPILHTSLLPAR